jgi:hypothetical protein
VERSAIAASSDSSGAIDEQVGGGAVHELVALLGDLREEGGDDALPHHAAGYRHLLEEDVLDALGLDPLGDRLDLLTASGLIAGLLERLGRHGRPRAVENGFDVAAKRQGGRRVNSDAVAHTSPPEVVGPSERAESRARRDYNAALSKFV